MNDNDTAKRLLYHNYANLSMAHAAIVAKRKDYGDKDYEIRSAMFRDLMNGTKKIRPISEDDQFLSKDHCNYCGSNKKLTTDYIFPKGAFPEYENENEMIACSVCKKSRKNMDLLEWMDSGEDFLPLMVIRRYFKLVHLFCLEKDLMSMDLDEALEYDLPFEMQYWPEKFWPAGDLKLVAKSKK
ncbi:MAG: hypothetical protein IPG02_08475 [Ignavibacteria bacterium]|jgi:hypothetical protein|nr:hypothetical protein [Ignavibacteria bacterium]MBK9225987.1 hypothetical protein [Ignavibacteria bacterium]